MSDKPSLEPPNNLGGGRGRPTGSDWMSALPAETRNALLADRQKLVDLEEALLAAGLAISFGKVSAIAKGELIAMVDIHGIPALVQAARKAHRPESPTRHAHGILPLWKAMPRPRAARPSVPHCGECDHGWLDDDDQGRAVRCSCRNTAVSGGTR